MELLNSASISIRHDDQAGKFIAIVFVGYSSSTASDRRPEMAIGHAVMKQANMTESKLTKALGVEEGQGDEPGWSGS